MQLMMTLNLTSNLHTTNMLVFVNLQTVFLILKS